MEDFSLDIEWDKICREGLGKIIEAQTIFIPVSESITSPPQWEVAMDRQQSIEHSNATNANKLVPKNIKTFIPGKVFFPKDVESCLTKREQAICLNVLNLYQSGHDLNRLTVVQQQEVQTYRSLQSKIQEENAKFLEYVKGDWQKRYRRAETIKGTLRTYAWSMWEKKLKRSLSYSQFYKAFNVVPLAVQDYDPSVNVTHCQDILHLGTVAKFSCPTLTSKYTFKVHTLPPQENGQIYNSKLPVSQDAHIKSLLDNYAVDVVLSSSTLKRLMDDGNFDVGWDIAVVVKLCNVKQVDGTFKTKNVIYIDKPLPKKAPCNVDFNEQCHKRLVRTNLCQIPEIVHQNSEATRMNPNYYGTSPRTKRKLNSNCKSVSSVEEGEITNEENPVKSDKFLCFTDDDEDEGTKNLNENTINHNVSYSIWNIKQSDEQNILMKNRKSTKDFKFLVRCKVDACERLENKSMRPLVVVPKLEYQLEHGANISTKSELIRQWTDLFFRPYSHLYRVRLMGSTSEVVAVESVSMQKINTEAVTHYECKPHLRLGVLYTIFSVLDTLQPGNYLLHHTPKIGPFVELLKEVDPDTEVDKTNIFDLHQEYNKRNCRISASNKAWCPIDVNYILPVHATYKRLPGMFKPLIVPFVKKPTKKAAKKKGKRRKNAKKGEKAKQ